MAQIPVELYGRLLDVIAFAFDEPTLRRVLRIRMEASWDNVVIPGGTHLDAVQDVVNWAQADDREIELIHVLAQARPRNNVLFEAARSYGLLVQQAMTYRGQTAYGVADIGDSGLQALVTARLPAVDLMVWKDRLAEIETRVCRVTLDGHSAGTGFLVGPQAVLTNYHVLGTKIRGETPDAAVACMFDYKLLPTGARPATVVPAAADNWLIDFSEPTAGEREEDPTRTVPTEEELDYAVIRLVDPVGKVRGYERVPAAEYHFPPAMAMLIPQHPDGLPMKLAFDTDTFRRPLGGPADAVPLGPNANVTRVRYLANTDPGASGSPCFDYTWQLVAVHHYGDCGAARGLGYNQGVPAWRIGRRLRRGDRPDGVRRGVSECVG